MYGTYNVKKDDTGSYVTTAHPLQHINHKNTYEYLFSFRVSVLSLFMIYNDRARWHSSVSDETV